MISRGLQEKIIATLFFQDKIQTSRELNKRGSPLYLTVIPPLEASDST